jgi:flagellar hook protein FlgE
MSLYSSFYSSLSGLTANSGMLGVIGNNLANLNTIGFKGSSSTFQDLFNASMGSNGTSGNGNPMQVGLGSQLGAIAQNFGQGSFQSTGNVTDMAISGSGFFMLQPIGGGQIYSRAGNFTFDNTGFLVNPNGDEVLGWNRVGNTLTAAGATVPIQINMGTISPPVATTTVTVNTNLDSNAITANPAAVPPIVGATFSTPLQAVDSLGATHTILVTYTKVAPTVAGAASQWTAAYSSSDAAGVTGPSPIAFNNLGVLISPTTDQNIVVTGWTNGAANQTVNWDIWDATGTTATLTGYAAPSGNTGTTQDGFGAGTIRSLVVDADGIITGNFTNGQTLQLARIALATFTNMNGLSKEGNNSWSQTLASGVPNVGPANDGGHGKILGGQLELSNVDTAAEFTQLIVAQRGYQANSRIVTTADTLLQEVLNMVR